MSTLTTELPETGHTSRGPRARTDIAPIPTGRLLAVELRKMFDTRSGFWLVASIGIVATLATIGVIAFAPEEAQTFDTFGSAVGFPMSVILPMVAILSVTSEWSQRSGLTTFTLVPHRGRVIAAKGACAVAVAVIAMVITLGIGALGNVVGTAISGAPTTWDLSTVQLLHISLAYVIGMMMGFTLGVLFRSSAVAIVGYFGYSLLLPTIFGMLAAFQEWFRDLQPWIDLNYAATRLYDTDMTGEYWAQLGVAGLIWLAVPLTIGLVMLRRSEVK